MCFVSDVGEDFVYLVIDEFFALDISVLVKIKNFFVGSLGFC